eukprot:6205413-Pleurochrysis_carterae.AAC.2
MRKRMKKGKMSFTLKQPQPLQHDDNRVGGTRPRLRGGVVGGGEAQRHGEGDERVGRQVANVPSVAQVEVDAFTQSAAAAAIAVVRRDERVELLELANEERGTPRPVDGL